MRTSFAFTLLACFISVTFAIPIPRRDGILLGRAKENDDVLSRRTKIPDPSKRLPENHPAQITHAHNSAIHAPIAANELAAAAKSMANRLLQPVGPVHPTTFAIASYGDSGKGSKKKPGNTVIGTSGAAVPPATPVLEGENERTAKTLHNDYHKAAMKDTIPEALNAPAPEPHWGHSNCAEGSCLAHAAADPNLKHKHLAIAAVSTSTGNGQPMCKNCQEKAIAMVNAGKVKSITDMNAEGGPLTFASKAMQKENEAAKLSGASKATYDPRPAR